MQISEHIARRLIAGLATLALACSGCAASGSEDELGSTTELGSLQLPLQSTSGASTFRLEAVFQYVGPQSGSLATADFAADDGVLVEEDLPAGVYDVTIDPNWVLLEDRGAGFTALDSTEVELVSPVTQSVSVGGGVASSVAFVFRAGDRVIELQPGSLAISFAVLAGSCADSCGSDQPVPGGTCFCDSTCVTNGDCCADFDAFCGDVVGTLSCVGFCGDQTPGGCFCDADCVNQGDCCDDFTEACP